MGQNPMEDESMQEMDDGAYSLTGLDPVQIEYAQRIAEERAERKRLEMEAMMNVAPPYFIHSGAIDPAALTAGPGHLMPAVPGGNTIQWKQYAKPMAIIHETTPAEHDQAKRRHLKLFVHFAKQFAERYPKWTVVPDEKDPLHSVHLLMKERGAMIHDLFPSNEMAVYGGPASWTDPKKELGQALPIVKINTQEFWGWCVGMDDVPEWMI